MSDNQMFGGSICITDLMDMLNKRHSSISKSAKNNKVYGNIVVWVNAEPDEYGNSVSIQLSSTKEKREQEKQQFGKGYIGNAKKIETNKPISERDVPSTNWDAGIPVSQPNNNSNDITEPDSDLPF